MSIVLSKKTPKILTGDSEKKPGRSIIKKPSNSLGISGRKPNDLIW